ncbi:hypothetical protein ASPU41_03315 [Arthrobacter sp. U41]|nr:hypothetical protein ASPU41_03315 [Arthrobacter sp. U41]
MTSRLACMPSSRSVSRAAGSARRQAEDFVAASDIVKASDEDLRWLYPDRTPRRRWQRGCSSDRHWWP